MCIFRTVCLVVLLLLVGGCQQQTSLENIERDFELLAKDNDFPLVVRCRYFPVYGTTGNDSHNVVSYWTPNIIWISNNPNNDSFIFVYRDDRYRIVSVADLLKSADGKGPMGTVRKMRGLEGQDVSLFSIKIYSDELFPELREKPFIKKIGVMKTEGKTKVKLCKLKN